MNQTGDILTEKQTDKVTRAILMAFRRVVPTTSVSVPPHVLKARAEGKIISRRAATEELELTVAYAFLTVLVLFFFLIIELLFPDQHSVLMVLMVFSLSIVVSGNILHTIRHLWARRVVNQQSAQFKRGLLRDFTNLPGERSLSSDRDLFIQFGVGIVFVIIFILR